MNIMNVLYPYVQLIHLICAIIFLGFIFTDVVLLSQIKKVLGEKTADKVFSVIMQRGVKIMPFCLFLLIITGGMMISQYMGIEKGFFTTPLQKILMIKIICAISIVILAIVSLYHKIRGKKNPLGNVTHGLMLLFGICIVILAKAIYI